MTKNFDIINCHHCGKECSYQGRRVMPVIIRSKRIGTPSKLNDKQAELLKIRHAQGVKIKELIQVFKISRTSVYKYLK